MIGSAWKTPLAHRILVRALLAVALLGMSGGASAGLWWKDVKHRCIGTGKGEVSARLEGIPWGQSWENTCNGRLAQKPPPMTKFGASGRPLCRKDALNTGIWGIWTVNNDTRCPSQLKWIDWKKAGCFGPNAQVYSARLWGSRNWEHDCAETDTRSVSGKENWGKPDRCVKDALHTGIWGEWYRKQEACSVPLAWGAFKDNGCVKDMKTPDANAGGISLQGKRSYSSVLWNAGGDWLEACRFAPAMVKNESGRAVGRFQYPTACVLADANRALGYVLSAAFGGAASLITAPASPVAAAALGAALATASTGATEAILAGADTSLNVWGVFWVDDASCGPVQSQPALDASGQVRLGTGQIVAATAPVNGNSASFSSAQQLERCPDTAQSLRGTRRVVTCTCSAQQTRNGQVWGTGPYTDDSKICRAAVHAGAIPPSGGNVRFQMVAGRAQYSGSSRNGVVTAPYGAWHSSFLIGPAP